MNTKISIDQIIFLVGEEFRAAELQNALKKRGVETVFLSEPREVYGNVSSGCCDILVIDSRYVGKGWKRMLNRIREKTDNVRILLVTDVDSAGSGAGCLECGIDNICSAPFEMTKFLTILEYMLKSVRVKRLNESYCKKVRYLKEEFFDKKSRLEEDLDTFRSELEDQMEELKSNSFGTVTNIVHILERKDPFAAGHAARVREVAGDLGRRMGLSRADIDIIERAGLCHDVGKIFFSKKLLRQQFSPAGTGQEKIRQHPVLGAKILSPFPHFVPVVPLVRHHHERMDGKGYPDGLGADELTVPEKVIIAADAYDSMTADRPQRPALSKDEVLRAIGDDRGARLAPEMRKLLVEYCEERG